MGKTTKGMRNGRKACRQHRPQARTDWF